MATGSDPSGSEKMLGRCRLHIHAFARRDEGDLDREPIDNVGCHDYNLGSSFAYVKGESQDVGVGVFSGLAGIYNVSDLHHDASEEKTARIKRVLKPLSHPCCPCAW